MGFFNLDVTGKGKNNVEDIAALANLLPVSVRRAYFFQHTLVLRCWCHLGLFAKFPRRGRKGRGKGDYLEITMENISVTFR